MQGLYNTPFNISTFYQQTQQLFDIGSSNLNNQNLVSILYGHKQVIEKLLENQNVLKARIDGPMRFETTDTEHSRNDSDV